MEKYPKYIASKPIPIQHRQWPNRILTEAPTWTSVDLRDGNQALPIPMSPEQKLQYFKMLVGIGFKEIEVGFPSASQDDFNFVRELIEQGHIPSDVRISVLTQARKHLIDRTVESLAGVKQAILHCYVATSDLHGRFVFDRNREEVEEMAVEGTRMVVDALEHANMRDRVAYEFSPEEFTDSDLDFVLELCTKVKDVWGPAKKKDFILNLPATVERRPPNQYADMIESFISRYPYMDEATVSIHAHNDQGCAVAASELALLAGATRAEGTLFGHGERTGNLDIMVLALNLKSRGIDPKLDFSHMNDIVRVVEENSNIEVHVRHPYAGQLVFTAFSGSHQDAIRKGFTRREEIQDYFHQGWKMPYLHIDPADVGRAYENLIRINSQSGKGGVVYVLEKEFGIRPPKQMHQAIGKAVQDELDKNGGEFDSKDLLKLFNRVFVNLQGPYSMNNYTREVLSQEVGDYVGVIFNWRCEDREYRLSSTGNGPISAMANALLNSGKTPKFKLEDFSEQTLGSHADAKALAFVGLRIEGCPDLIYGAGEHSNIDRAAFAALITALNLAVRHHNVPLVG
ncbi:MAG: 2-isopropylmalate synthase [Victivallaceae bacterium]|nr:2-isopropylmalate synthase [Victivallaceae bacterium]